MEKDVDQYHAWGGDIARPIWPDMQGWTAGNVVMTEVLGTPVPSWLRKSLRSQKTLADIEKVPLLGREGCTR